MCLGIPGRILRTWIEPDGQRLAQADFVGELRTIRTDYLPDLAPGDWTILHAGFALTRLEEAEARRTLDTMREVGLLDAVEPPAPTPTPECTDDICVTCSDEGRPGTVERAPQALYEPALVRTASGVEEVDMTLVGEVRPGDEVLIHAGMALTIVNGDR